ncbi:MAG: MATE family efflux transporter [Steroidobacteraceae bacterium]|jgi:MATE family multidrug resistance protein|nr:MATE family efflux transporter [Steroidobacteraceae bacterium]
MTATDSRGLAHGPLPRFAADARAIWRLGLPLLVNNLSVAGMSFAGTVMAGQLGREALAAVAVGSAYYHLFMMFGLGILMALSPLCAHAYGAGDSPRVGAYARQAVWLVLGIGAIGVAGMSAVRPLLEAIGTDPAIVPTATGYVLAVACGLPAMFGFLALRSMSEGVGHTRPIMYIAVLGLVVNVFGNWVFMYGKLGAPALGAVGTGASTALTMWTMFLTMLLYVRRHRVYRPFALFARFEWPDRRRLREMLGLGLPICGSVMSESGLFVAAALIMGALGAVNAAAHQIALNYASFMFMVPLALHSATTIHVGHLAGAGNPGAARAAGLTGIAICAGLMVVSAIVIVFANRAIADIYTDDAQVLALAATLLLYAAVFQVSDGVQIGAAGALRGFKDAKVPMLLNFTSYWLIGFPLAYGLGVAWGGGPHYVWLGLIAGLTVCAIALTLRFRFVSARAIAVKTAATTRAPVATNAAAESPASL